MASSDVAKVETHNEYDEEVSPTDDGSSSSENTATNVVDEEKHSSNIEVPPKTSTSSWDGPDDPDNPQNWPKSKKWSLTFFSGTVLRLLHTKCITDRLSHRHVCVGVRK